MNNVLILGAGSSFDAGIPLLSGFVDKMWEFALRRTANGNPLTSADIETFDRAVNVRNDLSAYHGRASFDDRNIEDLLSILSFNALAGDRTDRAKLEAFNQAITRTIELSCAVQHPGGLFPEHRFFPRRERPGVRRILGPLSPEQRRAGQADRCAAADSGTAPVPVDTAGAGRRGAPVARLGRNCLIY